MSNPNEAKAPVNPEEFRAMAAAIGRVEASMVAIGRCGLTEEAMVILLHHRTRVAQRDIKAVLAGLRGMGEQFLTPEYRKQLKDAAAKAA